MATLTLVPNANGPTIQHSQYPAQNYNYDKVDDPPATPDDDTTYVENPTLGATKIDIYLLQDMPVTPVSISNVRVYSRGRCVASGGYCRYRFGLYIGTSYYYKTDRWPGTGWVTYYDDWATNPATGAAWTKADIDALRVYLRTTVDSGAPSGTKVRCTQEYIEVTGIWGVAHTQTISEVLGMVDSVDKVKGLHVTAAESLGMVDSVAKRADLKQAVTDQLGMLDSAVAPGTLHLSVADQLGMLDSVAKARGQKVSVAESLGLVDALVPRRGLKQTITDALGLLDSTVPRRGLKQTVTEQLGLVDSAVPRNLMRRPTNGLNHTTIGGVPKDPDLPDNVEAIYVSVKNTWQDADNLDDEHGYRSYIWIPEETFQVRIMKLHVYAEKFRAYSKAALSKDLGTKTSVGGGAHRHLMYPYYTDGVAPTYWELHMFQNAGGGIGISRHPMPDPPYDRQDHYTYETVPAHTHNVVLGSHDHSIDFGIYEEAITGRTLSAKLYDPDGNLVKDFGVITTGEADIILDLSEYFETLKYGMYCLDLMASGRLRARCIFYELCLMYAY